MGRKSWQDEIINPSWIMPTKRGRSATGLILKSKETYKQLSTDISLWLRLNVNKPEHLKISKFFKVGYSSSLCRLQPNLIKITVCLPLKNR